MKRLTTTLGLVCAVGTLALAGSARAEETFSPFALNAWAGIALDYLNSSGPLSSSNVKVGANFGGDVGLRFAPTFAVVALAEYAPIFSSDIASSIFTVGGGIRFQPASTAQFLLGAGYSSLEVGGGSTGGYGIKAIGFAPIAMGLGPYLQLAYHNFSPSGVTLSVFSLNGGISFSY